MAFELRTELFSRLRRDVHSLQQQQYVHVLAEA